MQFTDEIYELGKDNNLNKTNGNSLDFIQIFNVENDDETVIDMYIIELEKYIRQLEIRANATQDIYDKLVNDCINLIKRGLMIDVNSCNYHFDKEVGYTIINPIPLQNNNEFYDCLPHYIALIIFGYGRPKLYQNEKFLNYMSREYHDRLFKATNKIIRKYKKALSKYGYSNLSIKKALYIINDNLYVDNITIVDNKEIINFIHNNSKILKK